MAKKQLKAKIPEVEPAKLDVKAQRRALQFLNRARSPAELAILPSRRVYEPRELGPGQLAIHDEDEPQATKLLDDESARALFDARGRISPVWGCWQPCKTAENWAARPSDVPVPERSGFRLGLLSSG
jgi:hypothetical protein